MLVLQLRKGGKIVLHTADGPLTMTVARYTRSSLRLGFDLPDTVIAKAHKPAPPPLTYGIPPRRRPAKEAAG